MRRTSRVVAVGMRTGALLLSAFAFLEALVLFFKRPEPWSGQLASRLLWSPLLHAILGLGLGLAGGAVAALLLSRPRRRLWVGSERASERAAVWSLVLPATLGFFWIYAVNRLYPGNSREPVALALDGAVLVASLALAALLWRRSVPSGARLGRLAVWTAVLALLLWLPIYIAAGAPSLEHTRVSHPPAGIPAISGDAPNVVLIMIDTVRTDCLSCYGPTEFETPEIDAFAEGGVLFEQAVTPEPLTRPAVCTLLTGLHPRTHGVDSNTKALGADFATLAELMRAIGYRTSAFTAASVLSGDFGTAQGFDLYSEPSEPWWYLRSDCAARRLYLSLTSWGNWWVEIPAEAVTRRAVDWLANNGDRPFFAFVHYFDAHAPYAPPRAYDLALREGLGYLPPPYGDEQVRFAPDFEMPAGFLRQEWLRYRGEITYVDEELGKLVRYLDDSGLSDRTFVIVAGDHGESFEHQAWFSHGTRLYDPQIHVPLVVRGPGLPSGERVASQVRLTDVFPTLLSLAGQTVPANVQGVDLCPIMGVTSPSGGASDSSIAWTGEGDLPAYSQTDLEDRRPLSSRISYSLRQPPWKYIDSPELGLKELYHLQEDPGETENLASIEPEVLERLGAALRAWQSSTSRLELEAEELSPEVIESLRALGYVQ